MKAKTLLKELQEAIKEHGEDLVVAVEADHGQQVMHGSWAGVSEVHNTNQYEMEIIDEEDCLHYDDVPKGVKIFHIQGY